MLRRWANGACRPIQDASEAQTAIQTSTTPSVTTSHPSLQSKAQPLMRSSTNSRRSIRACKPCTSQPRSRPRKTYTAGRQPRIRHLSLSSSNSSNNKMATTKSTQPSSIIGRLSNSSSSSRSSSTGRSILRLSLHRPWSTKFYRPRPRSSKMLTFSSSSPTTRPS